MLFLSPSPNPRRSSHLDIIEYWAELGQSCSGTTQFSGLSLSPWTWGWNTWPVCLSLCPSSSSLRFWDQLFSLPTHIGSEYGQYFEGRTHYLFQAPSLQTLEDCGTCLPRPALPRCCSRTQPMLHGKKAAKTGFAFRALLVPNPQHSPCPHQKLFISLSPRRVPLGNSDLQRCPKSAMSQRRTQPPIISSPWSSFLLQSLFLLVLISPTSLQSL